MICVAALEFPVPYERKLPWWAELDSEKIIEEYRKMRKGEERDKNDQDGEKNAGK